jgi:hypothetical protein
MTDALTRDDLDLAAGIEEISRGSPLATDARWSIWLWTFLSLSVGCNILLYCAVVLIDPFSTGRFALTQRVDLATENTLLVRAGLVRDRQFDGAIIGASSGLFLDPINIAQGTRWRIAQLGAMAASPASQLTLARAFERYHPDVRTLEIFVLDAKWCRTVPAEEGQPGWPPFPTWLYEGSDREYLSRILFRESLEAAFVRIGIWLGYHEHLVRIDGYAPWLLQHRRRPSDDPRPTGGPPADAPFPAIDALAAHIAAIASDNVVVLAFAPPYISQIPADRSIAAARLDTCKSRVQSIAAAHPNSAYLDLMTDNAITRSADNFGDPIHYTNDAARLVEGEIRQVMRENRLLQ